MTVSQAVESIIIKRPFILEAMVNDLINISSLARMIHQDVEEEVGKQVKIGAIVMAIIRMPNTAQVVFEKSLLDLLASLGDVIVRSDLIDFTYSNSPTLMQNQAKMLEAIDHNEKYFYSFSKGIYETTIVASNALTGQIQSFFNTETLVMQREDLAAVSVMLPTKNLDVRGVYYHILKLLAWNGINIIEVISTSHEITLVTGKKDIDEVFSLIMTAKKR